MKEITAEELKKIQLDIMQAVHDYCEEHGFPYTLSCGSLIGAARHKGYIPWDDDIDIYLLRDDYERLVREFPKVLKGKYVFGSLERDPQWGLAFGKIYDTTTLLKENVDNDFSFGVYIDVFPLDNVPVDDKQWKRFDRKRRFLQEMYGRRLLAGRNLKWRKDRPFYRNIARILLNNFLMKFSVRNIAMKISDNSQKYRNIETDYVFENVQGIFYTKRFPKAIFYERQMMPFEDKEFMCIKDYDTYLTLGYGNWRQLPPKEKQVTHHDFKAWWKDDNDK